MSKRKLPAVLLAALPGVRSEVSQAAHDRWNPGIQAATNDNDEPATISILDVIGEDFFNEGVTPKRIAGALRAIGKRDVIVDINSPGGSLFDGIAIYNLLREHDARVTVRILGVAASAASVIAMAGDTIRIARAGFLMIHNTWIITMGDRHDLRETADALEPFDAALADIYQVRTGVEKDELVHMLDRETWIGGSEAVERGFADALLASDEVVTPTNRSSGARELHALRELETYLAKANCPRSKRGDLVAALKGTQRDAGATDLRDAADNVVEMIRQHRKA